MISHPFSLSGALFGLFEKGLADLSHVMSLILDDAEHVVGYGEALCVLKMHEMMPEGTQQLS